MDFRNMGHVVWDPRREHDEEEDDEYGTHIDAGGNAGGKGGKVMAACYR